MDEVKADSELLNQKLGSTQKSLELSLGELAKEKVSRVDHSVKRARTEVVSELKSIHNPSFLVVSLIDCVLAINYTQEREALTQQLQELKEENTKALQNLEELANKEKEKTREQEKTISILQQNCEETSRKYTALKQEYVLCLLCFLFVGVDICRVSNVLFCLPSLILSTASLFPHVWPSN